MNSTGVQAEWSPEVNGLRYRCGTSQERYHPGDQVFLRAGYHNVSKRPTVILVNGSNLDVPGGLLQFAQSPLYSAEKITITPGSSIRAVWSNMFPIFAYRVLQPGEEYQESALLSTPFWEAIDEQDDKPAWLKPVDSRSLCRPEFSAGSYRLEAVYSQPGIPEETLRKMKAFRQRPAGERDVDAFFQAEIMGFSFNDLELFASWDFNLWAGTLASPAVMFEMKG